MDRVIQRWSVLLLALGLSACSETTESQYRGGHQDGEGATDSRSDRLKAAVRSVLPGDEIRVRIYYKTPLSPMGVVFVVPIERFVDFEVKLPKMSSQVRSSTTTLSLADVCLVSTGSTNTLRVCDLGNKDGL